jgi:glycosyltransferase involved in cell wall biosynthesis
MTGQNIICFAKDWSEDPTSNNHVMRMLARQNRVLWLNSIATRRPNFGSRNDLGKIGRKLRYFARGPQAADESLWVYTPIVLPFPHSVAATRLNREILRGTLTLLRRRLHMDGFQLWTFLPTAVEYVGRLGESMVVYYCTDEWSQFSNVDGVRMSAMERALCERADVVFTTSRTLLEKKRAFNPETHLASHGVDHAHFARSLDDATAVAPELADLRGPVLGFLGLIQDWVDVELLAYLARERPEWNLVVVGKALCDTSSLAGLRNVRMVGRKPYAELPAYCKAFSVGLIPFRSNELTRNVNPIKLREYLSAGLPVVSSGVPEVKHYPEWCAHAETHAEFLAACERALAEDSPERRQARSQAMLAETWERKVAELAEHVARVSARKR